MITAVFVRIFLLAVQFLMILFVLQLLSAGVVLFSTRLHGTWLPAPYFGVGLERLAGMIILSLPQNSPHLPTTPLRSPALQSTQCSASVGYDIPQMRYKELL